MEYWRKEQIGKLKRYHDLVGGYWSCVEDNPVLDELLTQWDKLLEILTDSEDCE